MPYRERFAQLADHFWLANARGTNLDADMSFWFKVSTKSPLLDKMEIRAGDLLDHCGTSGCIGGTAICLFAEETILEKFNESFEEGKIDFVVAAEQVDELGANLLGLAEFEANTLFFKLNWSSFWQYQYQEWPARTMAEICSQIADGADIIELLNQEEDDE